GKLDSVHLHWRAADNDILVHFLTSPDVNELMSGLQQLDLDTHGCTTAAVVDSFQSYRNNLAYPDRRCRGTTRIVLRHMLLKRTITGGFQLVADNDGCCSCG